MGYEVGKEEILLLLVFLGMLVFSFSNPSLTGFAVIESGDAEIEASVIDELESDGKVDVIVVLKEDSDSGDVIEDTNRFTFLRDNLDTKIEYNNFDGFAGEINTEGLARLKNDPRVEKVFLDRELSLTLDSSAALINSDDVVNSKIKGVSIDGSGETVCVIDTGIDYNHPNLVGKVIGGYDFVNNDEDAMDDHGHGTHIAGIIASNDSTYRGIAPGASLVSLKILNSAGSGLESDLVAAIDWCMTNAIVYNISVITMSLGAAGSQESNSTFCDQFAGAFSINYAHANGFLVTAASGNEGFSNGVNYPACATNATSVGSVDDNDNIAGYSNTDEILSLMAPGSSITSMGLGGGLLTQSGTSMAAPHVAAAAILLKQYERIEENKTLTVNELLSLLKNNGVNVSRGNLIFSRIDVLKSIRAIDDTDPEIIFNIGNVSLGNNVTISWDVIDPSYEYSYANLSYGGSFIAEFSNGESVNLSSDGEYIVDVWANDSLGHVGVGSSSFWVENVSIIIEEEPINDSDGDGIADSVDRLVGVVDNITTNLNNIGITIDGDSNVSQIFDGVKEVILKDSSDDLVKFNFNFNSSVLNLSEVVIYKQNLSDGYGYTLVKGVAADGTKSVYVEDVNGSYDRVCVKDAVVSSISEVSDSCDGVSESKVVCNGTSFSGYVCNDLGAWYEITGLSNSVVKEISCVESWSCSVWSACSGGTKTRTCVDSNVCGSIVNKPSVSKSCEVVNNETSGSNESSSDSTSGSDGSSSGGGGGGGESAPSPGVPFIEQVPDLEFGGGELQAIEESTEESVVVESSGEEEVVEETSKFDIQGIIDITGEFVKNTNYKDLGVGVVIIFVILGVSYSWKRFYGKKSGPLKKEKLIYETPLDKDDFWSRDKGIFSNKRRIKIKKKSG